MERIINKLMRIFKKKYFVITFAFVCLITVLAFSYSFLSIESDWRLAGEISFKELNYTTSPTVITSVANSGTTYYDVTVTSLNEINTRYSLTYTSNIAGIEVKVSSRSVNDSNGIIGLYESGSGTSNTKVVRLAITNNTSSTGTITLLTQGGYTWNPESSIDLIEGYNKITGIEEESSTLLGSTIAEQLSQILNCTPTATSPCLFEENANNYLIYSDKNWRIMGIYLIGGEQVIKLVLNEPLSNEITYGSVTSNLTTFYNTLNTSLIRESSPFTCTGTTTISCTGSENIGLISKSEYDLIGGVDSYLYTKPDKDYWTNTANGSNYFIGTSRGINELDEASTACARPSIYLINTTVAVSGNGKETAPFIAAQGIQLTVNLNGTSSTLRSGYYASGQTYGFTRPVMQCFGGFSITGTGTSINYSANTLTMGSVPSTLSVVQSETFVVDLGGGSTTQSFNSCYGLGESITLLSPTKTGNTFLGWEVISDDATLNANVLTFGVTSTTIVAKWSQTFAYTGAAQTYTPYRNGYYQIEAWGAGSANVTYEGGKGGYTSGKIYLTQDEELYIYVGGEGSASTTSGNSISGGYNGGGGAYGVASAGGGATDIRLSTDTDTLNSRIMVAGGGGGAVFYSDNYASASGGDGGRLIGGSPNLYDGGWSSPITRPTGGTQIFGGAAGMVSGQNIYGLTGKFGQGAQGETYRVPSYTPGGGGGYYGGGNGRHTGGGGGSSFISGYAGSAAIIEGSTGDTRDHTISYVNSNGEPVELIDTKHYSGKYFVDGEMQAGVRNGNGQAKITYIGIELPRVNTVLNNVRYIKDCTNGSTSNGSNHWVDFQAIANGSNIARGKVGTLYDSSNAIVGAHSSYPFRHATDGNISFSPYASGSTQSGSQCFVIDLGSEQNLDEVAVWHYWDGGRTYNNNVTYTSTDGINWTIVINTTEAETSQGKRISAY